MTNELSAILCMLQLEKLNLPDFQYRVEQKNNQVSIFCLIRKKFVVLTPEEWVRQHFINYLIQHKKYPRAMVQVEREILFNNLKKRFDVVVYSPEGVPFMLTECKAAHVKLSQNTFMQASTYNLNLKSDYLVITNGLKHFCSKIDHHLQKYSFVQELPDYPRI